MTLRLRNKIRRRFLTEVATTLPRAPKSTITFAPGSEGTGISGGLARVSVRRANSNEIPSAAILNMGEIPTFGVQRDGACAIDNGGGCDRVSFGHADGCRTSARKNHHSAVLQRLFQVRAGAWLVWLLA